MSRRQQNYARQQADYSSSIQNKQYRRLENNLGFYRTGENNRHQTHSKFTTTLRSLFKIHSEIVGTDMTSHTKKHKINCIIQNYLLFNINWIFEEFANGISTSSFVAFIDEAVLKSATRRLENIDQIHYLEIGVRVDTRMLINTRSILLDTLDLFSISYNDWKLRTGYVAPHVQGDCNLIQQ